VFVLPQRLTGVILHTAHTLSTTTCQQSLNICTDCAIVTNNSTIGASDVKIQPMNQRIDLEGLTLEKLENGDLEVTHHKTNTTASLSAATLVRWLMRHLRALF
jgi:hypothetical protein